MKWKAAYWLPRRDGPGWQSSPHHLQQTWKELRTAKSPNYLAFPTGAGIILQCRFCLCKWQSSCASCPSHLKGFPAQSSTCNTGDLYENEQFLTGVCFSLSAASHFFSLSTEKNIVSQIWSHTYVGCGKWGVKIFSLMDYSNLAVIQSRMRIHTYRWAHATMCTVRARCDKVAFRWVGARTPFRKSPAVKVGLVSLAFVWRGQVSARDENARPRRLSPGGAPPSALQSLSSPPPAIMWSWVGHENEDSRYKCQLASLQHVVKTGWVGGTSHICHWGVSRTGSFISYSDLIHKCTNTQL